MAYFKRAEFWHRTPLRDLDCFIDLLGWEDRPPGFGRPQEEINEDVDRCELFVGTRVGCGAPNGGGWRDQKKPAAPRRAPSRR